MESSPFLDACNEALDRLIAGNPKRIKGPYTLSNDTVAKEAGKAAGSIRKARHRKLVEDIKAAREGGNTPLQKSKRKLINSQMKVKDYKHLYHEALNREVMHLHKIHRLQKKK